MPPEPHQLQYQHRGTAAVRRHNLSRHVPKIIDIVLGPFVGSIITLLMWALMMLAVLRLIIP